MNITLILVTSVNGKLTRGNESNIYNWTSKEDQQHFFSQIKKHQVIIMGRKTYEAAKEKIKLTPNKLRLVMTKHTKRYKTDVIPGELEFTDESPKVLIKRLKSIGHKKCLVVGGSEIAFSFLKAKLIDIVILTLEPHLFGLGKQFLPNKKVAVQLQLLRIKQLNKNGSLLLHYKVKYVKKS